MTRRAARGMDDEAIRLRLNRLLKKHTRAEIARKTGTSSVNVGRYARGTQIPAAFCAALVRKFGVNSNWMLLGEGPQDFSAVQPDSVREKDILNLVDSLNAVARLELGALGGDDHAKMLRELADTLETRDRLQKRLSKHSRTVLARILDEIEACVSKQDFNKAGDLRQLAVQVSRLCTDPSLETRLWEAEAKLEFLDGRAQDAVELYRRVMHARVGSGELLTSEACTTYSHFCYVLTRAGRSVEALRIVDAAEALANDEVRESPEWASLQGRRAQYLIDAGRLRDAYAVLHNWIPRVQGFRRSFLVTILQAALILGDNMNITDAMAVPPRIHSKGLWMVSLSLVMQSPELLRESGEYLITVEDENGVNRTEWSSRAFRFADLVDGRKNADVKELQQDLKQAAADLPHNPAGRVVFEALLTMYARYGSTRSVALKHLRETQRTFEQTELGNIEIWAQAIHAANAVQLLGNRSGKDAAIRKWAVSHIEQHIAAGYGMFRDCL